MIGLVGRLAGVVLVSAALALGGCAAGRQGVGEAGEAREGMSMESTAIEPLDPVNTTPEQVLAVLRDFLHDERMTVAEATRRLLGDDIPVTPDPHQENVSSGYVNLRQPGSFDLRQENKGFWYSFVKRWSRKSGDPKDNIAQLRVSVETQRLCISRDAADEILGVTPQVETPYLDAVIGRNVTPEQMKNPGLSVDYKLNGKKINLDFGFRKCAGEVAVLSE
ncbi:MAG: hypothetical protein ACOY3Z_01375 [Thermodesulfobacteriota bacterium]